MVRRLLLGLLALLHSVHAANFSVVIIPDSHLPNWYDTATWQTQAQWILTHRPTYNIVAALSTGDWNVATAPHAWARGMSEIASAGLYVGSAVGNHDYEAGDLSGEAGRITTTFDAQVGYGRVSVQPWFRGGVYTDSNTSSNYYYLLDIQGRHLLLLFLELFPRQTVMTWAAGIINANPLREVILLTHGYLNGNGTTIAAADNYGPNAYSLTGDYSGTDIETWAKAFPNLRAIFCGHQLGGNHALRTTTADDGHSIYGVFTNYQDVSPASRDVLLVQFSDTQIQMSIVNTTTGATDYTYSALAWTPILSGQATALSGHEEISGKTGIE